MFEAKLIEIIFYIFNIKYIQCQPIVNNNDFLIFKLEKDGKFNRIEFNESDFSFSNSIEELSIELENNEIQLEGIKNNEIQLEGIKNNEIQLEGIKNNEDLINEFQPISLIEKESKDKINMENQIMENQIMENQIIENKVTGNQIIENDFSYSSLLRKILEETTAESLRNTNLIKDRNYPIEYNLEDIYINIEDKIETIPKHYIPHKPILINKNTPLIQNPRYYFEESSDKINSRYNEDDILKKNEDDILKKNEDDILKKNEGKNKQKNKQKKNYTHKNKSFSTTKIILIICCCILICIFIWELYRYLKLMLYE